MYAIQKTIQIEVRGQIAKTHLLSELCSTCSFVKTSKRQNVNVQGKIFLHDLFDPTLKRHSRAQVKKPPRNSKGLRFPSISFFADDRLKANFFCLIPVFFFFSVAFFSEMYIKVPEFWTPEIWAPPNFERRKSLSMCGTVCRSVRLSVSPFVGTSVRRSVRRSGHRLVPSYFCKRSL